jgi:hypothetical protein
MNALIVIYGNPIDGFKHCGPFHLREDAITWADHNIATEYDWWVVDMEEPGELT